MACLFVPRLLTAQMLEARYTIETTFDGDTIMTLYEKNKGKILLNTVSGELLFKANLADIRTANDSIDSLLMDEEKLFLVFQANIGQSISDLIGKQNDDRYHKIIGTVQVDNKSYSAEAYIKFKNLSDKSDLKNLLMDLKLEVDPKQVHIPYLSDFFEHILILQVNECVVRRS